MDIYSSAILVSLFIYVAVGNYAGRRVKKLDDYFVAGRRAPTLLIVGTLVASVLSTNIFSAKPASCTTVRRVRTCCGRHSVRWATYLVPYCSGAT